MGLAVDIVDASWPELNQSQEQTAVQQWLMAIVPSMDLFCGIRWIKVKSQVSDMNRGTTVMWANETPGISWTAGSAWKISGFIRTK